jgi:imidazolonepropionase-like amidohydrolase
MVLGGMTPIEAIQAATTTNAFLLGIDNEVGQIKEGFFADIIAVNENPLVKITTLENVIFVMKDGVIYKN